MSSYKPRAGKRVRRTYRGKTRTKIIPSKEATRAIQKIISKNIETKQVYHQQDVTMFNGAITSAGDLMFPLPNMPQNVSEAGRVGNHVRAQSLKIQGIITMNLDYSASYPNTRLGIRVLIVQPKLYTNRDVINSEWSAWTSNLLRKGQANTSFTGVVSDLYAPINSDLITTYYDKIFYVSMTYTPLIGQGDNNTAFSHKPFTANLKLRNKTLKYDTGYYGNLAPSNYCPVMLLGYVHLDGSAADTVQTQVSMSYISTMSYEDA